ncbi:MAG TPA: response regulator transcription factor [Gammaproteobacteria bacterium]|nr:response regulator transcription factor [Gammaproteobacteria bacterium]
MNHEHPTNIPSPPVHILLADDHTIFRQSLRELLQEEGFDVMGEASTGPEALHLAEEQHPDVAILDYNMPELDGISVARELQKSAPQIQTVLLTAEEDNASAVEALRAGMHGYVYKSQTAEDLISTIREVARGAIHFNTRLTAGALNALSTGGSSEPEPLTERERQVLVLIAKGDTTRDIARELGLSAKTVESHRSRIMQKLHVHRAAELIRYAIRRQLISP